MSEQEERRSDQQLLVAARESPAAFTALYRRHAEDLVRWFRRRGMGPEQALDLTAETFAEALASIESYRPGPTPGVAWLYGIARNELLDALRRGRIDHAARQRMRFEPLVVTDAGIAAIESSTGPTDIAAAMADLAPEIRQALNARVVEEHDYARIARDVGCSEHLVRQRVSRGLKRLRRNLEGQRS